MIHYLMRRILLIPFTLFAIILVNFVILNLAPGEPVNMASVGNTGEATRSVDESGATGDLQYLQFREHYGLTLPILFNTWPSITQEQVHQGVLALSTKKEEWSTQKYHEFKTNWGDRARFVLPHLLQEARDLKNSEALRRIAANLFIRGATIQGHVGPVISPEERKENRAIGQSNAFLMGLRITENDAHEEIDKKISGLSSWLEKMQQNPTFVWQKNQKGKAFFFETRFSRYLQRVVTLDFGTLRSDHNKTVISEVVKRIKYSLTLASLPMLVTFVLCQVFGMIMAVKQNQFFDHALNVIFLFLFAAPVFVVAPFLIEKVALNHTIPLTNLAIPYSGFHSSEEIYTTFTSLQRLSDVAIHLFLPLIAIMYGTLAIQARLSRTAFLEVLRQDYIRTARAKGLPWLAILCKHVGRNGAITIVTSLAASLGVVLGGSLIVETIFEINGFGRFFYEAIVNRDYNVVLFSAFAGSALTLIGYLFADISYMFLDPRVSLD